MKTGKHGGDGDAASMARCKSDLRSLVRSALKGMAAEKVTSDSAKIRALLQQQPFWRTAETILFFAPLPDEVNVWPLMEEMLPTGKTVALPRFDAASNDYLACRIQHPQTEISPGQFGIREPNRACPELPLERLGLVLVPGVAFDLSGGRLGRGRGFYDRLLAETRTIKCGVAFDEQIVSSIPAGARDIKMDFVLTPTRCAACGP
ncbi:MAG: 5-formyltetrahydrofolate cyclo-ligase [Verrucomicrobiota bacterium]|jgi:5-formyltetrahydrofolate cyclo-ligase